MRYQVKMSIEEEYQDIVIAEFSAKTLAEARMLAEEYGNTADHATITTGRKNKIVAIHERDKRGDGMRWFDSWWREVKPSREEGERAKALYYNESNRAWRNRKIPEWHWWGS